MSAVQPDWKWQIRDGGLTTGIPTSQSVDMIGTQFQGLSLFLKSCNPIGQPGTLRSLTESGNSTMAVSLPEVYISRLVNVIGTKFQLLCPCFWGRATGRDFGRPSGLCIRTHPFFPLYLTNRQHCFQLQHFPTAICR